MAEGAATASALAAHKIDDRLTVHGIYPLVRTLIPKYVPLAAPVDLSGSMTWDGSWRDLDLSANVSATVFMVKLNVRLTSDVVSLELRVRPNGSTSAAGECQSTWETVEADDTNLQARQATGVLDCSMVDQTIEYYGAKNGGTVGVYLIGYWQKGL